MQCRTQESVTKKKVTCGTYCTGSWSIEEVSLTNYQSSDTACYKLDGSLSNRSRIIDINNKSTKFKLLERTNQKISQRMPRTLCGSEQVLYPRAKSNSLLMMFLNTKVESLKSFKITKASTLLRWWLQTLKYCKKVVSSVKITTKPLSNTLI